MHVRYLPANMAFIVTLTMESLTPVSIGPDSRSIFNSREELETVLRSVGLKSDTDGNVSLICPCNDLCEGD